MKNLIQVILLTLGVSAAATFVQETTFTKGNMNQTEIDKIVEVLIDHDTLVLQDVETVRAALAVFRVAKKVEFPDCLILESARKAGHMPLCTFDRALAKLEGAQHVNDV